MEIKFCKSKAISILSDPFADEETWLSACDIVNSSTSLMRSRYRDFTDKSCGIVAGLFLTALAANFHVSGEGYSWASISIIASSIGYLYAIPKARQTKFSAALSITLSLSILIFSIFASLSPSHRL